MREQQVQNEILRQFATRPDIRLVRANVGLAVPYSTVRSALAALRDGDAIGAAEILGRVRPVQFGVKGQADLTGLIAPSGRRLEIEVKSATGRQSPPQAAWQRMIERLGGIYVLARSPEDVARALESSG